MPRPVHFEIQADDTERAAKFYTEIFGWEFTKWEGPMEYWVIKTGEGSPGIDGGMMREPKHANCINTIDVKNIDASMENVKKAGGEVTSPKMPIPGIGWHAYCKDPEGNLFGILQSDMSAK
ncbi:VOC family protein [bacterium]|nr:VOC family protein [bacterium]